MAPFYFMLGAMLVAAPAAAFADVAAARLGGGNALARVTIGQSQGIAHAAPASNLFDHPALASVRGGRPEETPIDQNSDTGGVTSSEQSDGEDGADAASAGGASNNGGVTAGNGGDGGNGGGAGAGGLVRAGNTVSNATALNAINTTIIRISAR